MVRNCQELGICMQKIMKRLLANQKLCKLVYYTGKDPLGQPDIKDPSKEIYEKYIKITPKLPPEETPHSFVDLIVANGAVNRSNGEFRNFTFRIYVYVPQDQWFIKDSNLRMFAILGEIQNSLSDKNINGLGTLRAGDIKTNLFTEDMTCYTIDFTLYNSD